MAWLNIMAVVPGMVVGVLAISWFEASPFIAGTIGFLVYIIHGMILARNP
jgi:hypothetical protein